MRVVAHILCVNESALEIQLADEPTIKLNVNVHLAVKKSRYLLSSPFGIAVGNIEVHDTMSNGNINEFLAYSQIGDTYARARCTDRNATVYVMSSSHIIETAVRTQTRGTRG